MTSPSYEPGDPSSSPSPSNGRWWALLTKHWLLVALLLSSCLAYGWPTTSIGSVALPDPFLLPKWGLQALVVVTMFCLGLSLRLEELKELRRHPYAVLLGVAVQCTWMPLLAWLAVQCLDLEEGLAQGVILVGCVPGAMASNVLTMTAKGNVSFSISLTTVATLLSPVTVPLALYFVGGVARDAVEIDSWAQSRVLFLTVVLPVLIGFLLKLALPKSDLLVRKSVSVLAGLALLWIIASVVAGNRDRLAQIQLPMLFALLMINLLGYLGGTFLGRAATLPIPMRRALALEVGMQNAGLGTFLAARLFGESSLAQIPTAAYTFGCMLTGTILASYWAGRSVDAGSNTSAAEPTEAK